MTVGSGWVSVVCRNGFAWFYIVTASGFIGVIKDECWKRLRHFVNQVYFVSLRVL